MLRVVVLALALLSSPWLSPARAEPQATSPEAAAAPPGSAAKATLTTSIEVLLILAHPEGEGSDAALARLEALSRPPFDAFPRKSLLAKKTVALELHHETEVALPNGRKLELLLLERTTDGRYRIRVSINRPGKQDYLPLLTVAAAPGDPFFVAGQKHAGGTLIVGLNVKQPGAAPGTP